MPALPRPGVGRYTGDLGDLPGRLYDLTKDMMDRLNVEFEYQVRQALAPWLLSAGATQAPVEQQPLTQEPLQATTRGRDEERR